MRRLQGTRSFTPHPLNNSNHIIIIIITITSISNSNNHHRSSTNMRYAPLSSYSNVFYVRIDSV